VILHETLKQLSVKEQEIIDCGFFEEKEFAEIATLLGKKRKLCESNLSEQ